jgi:hypothetical protein
VSVRLRLYTPSPETRNRHAQRVRERTEAISRTPRARHGKGDGERAASPATGMLSCGWREGRGRRGGNGIVPESDGSGGAVGSRDPGACAPAAVPAATAKGRASGEKQMAVAGREESRETWR